MLQDFIEYTAEADKTAAQRYNIARLRRIAGDDSITKYNITQEIFNNEQLIMNSE